MTKHVEIQVPLAQFRRLFERATSEALAIVGRNKTNLTKVEFELKGAGVSAAKLTADEIIERIFVSPTHAIPVIDLGVRVLDQGYAMISLMASGAPPVAWTDLQHGRGGLGLEPFNLVGFEVLSLAQECARLADRKSYMETRR